MILIFYSSVTRYAAMNSTNTGNAAFCFDLKTNEENAKIGIEARAMIHR